MSSYSLLQGIFPTEGSNPCVLYWQVDSLPLSHQGSPKIPLFTNKDYFPCSLFYSLENKPPHLFQFKQKGVTQITKKEDEWFYFYNELSLHRLILVSFIPFNSYRNSHEAGIYPILEAKGQRCRKARIWCGKTTPDPWIQIPLSPYFVKFLVLGLVCNSQRCFLAPPLEAWHHLPSALLFQRVKCSDAPVTSNCLMSGFPLPHKLSSSGRHTLEVQLGSDHRMCCWPTEQGKFAPGRPDGTFHTHSSCCSRRGQLRALSLIPAFLSQMHTLLMTQQPLSSQDGHQLGVQGWLLNAFLLLQLNPVLSHCPGANPARGNRLG